MANREAHLAYVAKAENKVKVAGPMFADDNETMEGSLLVIEAETSAEVDAWSQGDPYRQAGLFDRVEIHPFKWVIGKNER